MIVGTNVSRVIIYATLSQDVRCGSDDYTENEANLVALMVSVINPCIYTLIGCLSLDTRTFEIKNVSIHQGS